MHVPDSLFVGAQTVLDVGGWFIPEPRATHVVDLMPWETRRVQLTLTRQPLECFSKETWFQMDFLKPDLRLPFADKSIDLVLCGHTLEDLSAPQALLAEMQRVGRRGFIECPSRLTEQTLGQRDRETSLPGHPHHHWIVESRAGRLWLYAKKDSCLQGTARTIPLQRSEQEMNAGRYHPAVTHVWTDSIDYQIVTGDECRLRAAEFVTALQVGPTIRMTDSILRGLRRLRRKLRGQPAENFLWWTKIVELSRPYSSIELK